MELALTEIRHLIVPLGVCTCPTMTPEGSPIKNLAQRHADVAEQRRIEAEAWAYCCQLSEKERVAGEAAVIKAEEERVAGLHLSYVLRKQAVNGGRWNEICRLRAMEVFQGRVGLVYNFETWMRILDRRLSSHGIFIGSYTRKFMFHPELGEIPQLAYEDVIDLT